MTDAEPTAKSADETPAQSDSAVITVDTETPPTGVAQVHPAPAPTWSGYSPPAPAPPTFMQKRWTGPTMPGGPAAWIAALIGGVATALALPLSRPGVGWLLVGLVIAGAIVHAARFGPRPDSKVEQAIRIGWGVLAIALLSVGTFRAAGWLFVFCVLTAIGCASLAVAGGQSVRALIVGGLAVPLAAFRAIPWLAKGLAAASKARDKQKGSSRIVLAVLVTVVLLVVFGALFASADAAFAKMVGDILPELSARTVFRAVFFTIAGGLFTAGAIFTVLAPPDLSGLERPSNRRVSRIELALPLGGLVALFTMFVIVQLRFFFGDKSFIEKTSGMTYSKYAVQGFGQLVVVTLLTLAVIGLASRWATKETPAERTLLRVLLGALIALSLVIVASAIWRMWLYQNESGWTRERVFFGSIEIWLGGIFILIALTGISLKSKWFPRAAAASFAALLLSLAVINPERFIAEQNSERFETIDFWYLRALGPDAAPVLDDLPEPYRICTLSWLAEDLRNEPFTWYSWNLSRERARELVPVITAAEARVACDQAFQLNKRTRR